MFDKCFWMISEPTQTKVEQPLGLHTYTEDEARGAYNSSTLIKAFMPCNQRNKNKAVISKSSQTFAFCLHKTRNMLLFYVHFVST